MLLGTELLDKLDFLNKESSNNSVSDLGVGLGSSISSIDSSGSSIKSSESSGSSEGDTSENSSSLSLDSGSSGLAGVLNSVSTS